MKAQEWKPVLKKVSCIYLPASDPDKTKEWFGRHFGINNNGWLKLGVDGTLIFIKSKEKPQLSFKTDTWPGQAEGPDFEMNVLSFEVENTEKLYQSLKEDGVKVELKDNEGAGVEISFYDPDGNKYNTWELQIMVRPNHEKADSPNWKERFIFENCCFWCDVDDFLNKVIEGAPGARHPRVQIVEHAKIRESDPEGLEKLLETLDQFSSQYPEHTFRYVYREE